MEEFKVIKEYNIGKRTLIIDTNEKEYRVTILSPFIYDYPTELYFESIEELNNWLHFKGFDIKVDNKTMSDKDIRKKQMSTLPSLLLIHLLENDYELFGEDNDLKEEYKSVYESVMGKRKMILEILLERL